MDARPQCAADGVMDAGGAGEVPVLGNADAWICCRPPGAAVVM